MDEVGWMRTCLTPARHAETELASVSIAETMRASDAPKKFTEELHVELINVFDYEMLAEERMDPVHWDFYAGGSDDEVTSRANQTDFSRIRLRPRVLVDVSTCDMSTSVLGQPVKMPILVAPTALHCMAHAEGECATARGAGAMGTLMIASTVATC